MNLFILGILLLLLFTMIYFFTPYGKEMRKMDKLHKLQSKQHSKKRGASQ